MKQVFNEMFDFGLKRQYSAKTYSYMFLVSSPSGKLLDVLKIGATDKCLKII